MVFHHVGVHVSDFDKSKRLYDALIEPLGYESYDLPGHVAIAYGLENCSFRVVQPPNGKVAASSSHICLTAPSKDAVLKFFEIGTQMGARGVQSPNTYEDFGKQHLTSMIADFDGNHIEAVFVDQNAA